MGGTQLVSFAFPIIVTEVPRTGVNTAPDYVRTVGIGYTTFEGDLAAVQITDTLLQGGIVSMCAMSIATDSHD